MVSKVRGRKHRFSIDDVRTSSVPHQKERLFIVLYSDVTSDSPVTIDKEITIDPNSHNAEGITADLEEDLVIVKNEDGTQQVVQGYDVTVTALTNGSVTASPTLAAEGQAVTLTVNPDSGYQMTSISVTKESGDEIQLSSIGNGTYTFTMPGETVIVTATFSVIPTPPVITPSDPTYTNTVTSTENGKVTVSPTSPKKDDTVTITTTPNEGYKVGSVAVTDADDKTVTVVNAGGGKYTFKQPGSKVTIKVTFVWDNPFTDVKSTAWYYNAVKYVYENNLMAGTGDTTFDPEMNLTRAMTAQILYNLEGKPEVTEEATFTDMNVAPTWSVDAIAWAQDTGVVAGMGDDTFAPNANVTREQFAQMMYNYAKYKEYDLTKAGDLSKFPDEANISTWAETAMSWANGNGLINGHEDTKTIAPQGNTIRAQAASILMNFDLNVVK